MIESHVHQRYDPFRDLVHESQLITLQWMPDKSRQGEYIQARSDQNGSKTWIGG